MLGGRRSGLLLLVLAATAWPLSTASAATVTLGGNLEPPFAESLSLQGELSFRVIGVNTVPGPGTTLSAPADGTVTSWGILGSAQHGTAKLQVISLHPGFSFTEEGEAKTTLERGGESGAAIHLDGTPNQTALPIGVGDMLGVSLASTGKSGDHVEVFSALDGGAGYELTRYDYLEEELVPLAEPTSGRLLYNATVELLPPEISAMSPTSGVNGMDVTITGQHLAIATAVTFGGVPAAGLFRGADDTTITAIVPQRPAGGTVEVQVTTAGGTSAVVPAALFTYPTPPAEPDTSPPTISSLQLAPASFRAVSFGGSIIARRLGTRVSYRLSEAATTTFHVQRVLQGRRSDGHCAAPSRRNRRAPRCTRLTAIAGSFKQSAAAGADSLSFSGRLGSRDLPPGSYRLLALASDAAGNRSKPVTRAFTVVH
jgi:IPT/TIG domain